jgi:hypothetical protein
MKRRQNTAQDQQSDYDYEQDYDYEYRSGVPMLNSGGGGSAVGMP